VAEDGNAGTETSLVAPLNALDRFVREGGQKDTLTSEETPFQPEDPKAVKLPYTLTVPLTVPDKLDVLVPLPKSTVKVPPDIGRVIVGVPENINCMLGLIKGERTSVDVVSVVPSGLKKKELEADEGQLVRLTLNNPLEYAAEVFLNILDMFVQAVGVHTFRLVAANAVAPANIDSIFNTLETFQVDIF
jgi:hypothetical protein